MHHRRCDVMPIIHAGLCLAEEGPPYIPVFYRYHYYRDLKLHQSANWPRVCRLVFFFHNIGTKTFGDHGFNNGRSTPRRKRRRRKNLGRRCCVLPSFWRRVHQSWLAGGFKIHRSCFVITTQLRLKKSFHSPSFLFCIFCIARQVTASSVLPPRKNHPRATH